MLSLRKDILVTLTTKLFHIYKSLSIQNGFTLTTYPQNSVSNLPGLGSPSRSRWELGVFGSLEPEPLEKKIISRSRLENQEPEPLKN